MNNNKNLNKPVGATRSKQANKFISESDSLTRYCTRFASSPIHENSESLLEIKIINLNNFWIRLQAAHDAIVESDNSDLPQHFKSSAYDIYENCLDQYEETKAMISDQLKLIKTIAPTPHPRVELPQMQQYQEASSGIQLELPACDTETFYGGYEEWPSFRDMFTAVYINHPQLSQAQKLYHLRYKTKGQAGIIVKQFALNGDNFNLAWEALKARYENERILVDKQVTTLLNLPKIKKGTSEEFVTLQSTVSNCLSILSTQNIPTDSWDPILVNICTAALPEKSLLLWEQSLSSRKKCPTWQQMKDFLTTQYEIAERLEEKIIKTKKIKHDQTRSLNRPQARSKNKSNIIFNKIQSFISEQRIHTSCELCTRGHKLKSCEKFKKLNINERNNFVRSKRLCTNCLSHTHNLKNCKSKFNCLYCHKRHHTMLHYSTYPSPQRSVYTKRNTGLITKANPESQNTKNCQETPCCSKAQKSQTLHSERQSGLVVEPVPNTPTQVEKKQNQYLNSQLRKFRNIGKLPPILKAHTTFRPRRMAFANNEKKKKF
ncbi:uncharacterized protein LOC125779110 isoform X1 [Bactrocera dorsalis]|uniref:Uncharacterized protein LOC125779110 isoform X1 n=1 Tax=Bactrocera dorsalis TaxID=27457 RepID=A0ABM3K2B9_BACDO|nr:uncharacterized protein LOC125779110 isoform X1 [Bactrocera dorsalis]